MPNVKVEFAAGALHRGIREPLALEAFHRAAKLVAKCIHALDTGEQARYREWFDAGGVASRRQKVRFNYGLIQDALEDRPVVLAVAKETNKFAVADPNSPLFIWPLNLTGVELDTRMFDAAKKRQAIHVGSGIRIVLADLFFEQRDHDKAACCLIHELSHKTANTLDLAYGPGQCAALAENEPDRAINNADCYFYYALSGARPVRATD